MRAAAFEVGRRKMLCLSAHKIYKIQILKKW
jgi:hypothetical protein